MKKTYSAIIFSVIMLSLAIFSASFGIYAIMTAEMNMNLNVGYVAYNCSANVSGVITGASPEAEELPEDIQLSSVVVNGKNKQTQRMDLGTFYFTTEGVKNALGKPYPIKVWFTIENTSAFPICVEVSLPTITDVEVVADKTSHVIQAGETDKIMVTFTLTNISTTALERGFSSSGLNFTFKKFLKTKQDIVVYKDASVTHFENHPYYIKFGTNLANTDILWLVGGTMDANGQAVALTDADKTQLDTGKFAEDVDYFLLLMYRPMSVIPYQNNAYYGNSNADCYLLEYPSINNVLDYSLSTIRQFLMGNNVNGTNKNTAEKKYVIDSSVVYECEFEKYGFYDGYIYSLIKKRGLTSIYKTLGYGNTELSIPTDKADNLSAEESDAFWIPTEADISVLGEDVKFWVNGTTLIYCTYTHLSSGHPQKLTRYSEDGTSLSTYYPQANVMSYRICCML